MIYIVAFSVVDTPIDFNADLEPAYYFNEDPDPKQIHSDLSPNQTLLLQTVEFTFVDKR